MIRAWVLLWALPVTVFGLAIALVARASGGKVKCFEGVLEVSGGWPARVLMRGFPFSGAVAAMALGHVVVGVSDMALTRTRAHERAHVRQFERWGGLMLVLYPLAGLWAGMRGRHPYRDNVFEIQARAQENSGPVCKT